MIHHVYRYFDKGGTVIYVGVSKNMELRNITHKGQDAWFKHVYKIESQPYTNKRIAHKVEAALIKELQPLYNCTLRKNRPRVKGLTVVLPLTEHQEKFLHRIDYRKHGFPHEFIQEMFNEFFEEKIKTFPFKMIN